MSDNQLLFPFTEVGLASLQNRLGFDSEGTVRFVEGVELIGRRTFERYGVSGEQAPGVVAVAAQLSGSLTVEDITDEMLGDLGWRAELWSMPDPISRYGWALGTMALEQIHAFRSACRVRDEQAMRRYEAQRAGHAEAVEGAVVEVVEDAPVNGGIVTPAD